MSKPGSPTPPQPDIPETPIPPPDVFAAAAFPNDRITARERTLFQWRQQVLQGVLRGSVLLAIPGLIVGGWNALHDDSDMVRLRSTTLAIALLAYGLLVFVLLVPRLRYVFRAGVFLGAFYLLGTLTLLQSGRSGAGIVLLFAFVVFATILLDLRRGILALLLAMLALSLIATVHVNGWITPIPPRLSTDYIAPWIGSALLLLMLAVAAIISLSFLLGSLQRSLMDAEREREFISGVLDTAGALIVLIDRSGRIVRFNSACEKVTGFRAAEVIGQSVWNHFLEPADAEALKRRFARADSALTPDSVQSVLLTRAGARRVIAWSTTPMHDEQGKVAYIIACGLDITEHDRAQQALKTSEQKYRELVETSNDLIWSVDAQGCVTFVNRGALQRIHGYQPEEVLGRSFVEFLADPSTVERDRQALGRILVGEAISQYELAHRRKDGSAVHLIANGVPLRDESGKVIGATGTATDITQRKQAERALRASEARYRELVENANDIIYTHDPQSDRILSLNQAGERVTGFTRKEAMEMSLTELVVPEDRERARGMIASAIAGDRSDRFEVDVRTKDGRRVPLDVSIRLVKDGGRVVAIQGIARDISARKEADRQLRRMARFPDESPTPILRATADGGILYANKAAAPLLAAWGCAIGDKLPDHLGLFLRDVFASEGTQEVEAEVTTSVFSLLFAPIRDEGYVNIYGRDITEKKRAEQERARFEAQLQHAQKLESLGVLAGGIAHDFNNLLMGILGNAGLAIMEIDDPASPARESLQQIEIAAQRAADLTRQMLAYSGKGKFVIERIDLNALIHEMAHLLEVTISKKTTLRFEFSPALAAIEADATQIRQIIMNLITNAAEAIGDKSGTITIRTREVRADRALLSTAYLNDDLPEGRYACIEVADTGAGMDEGTLARIFDPFYTTKFTGRGLGLAAVLGIIRGHRGAIRVESQPGKGTRFTVLLPIVESSRPADVVKNHVAVNDWHADGVVLIIDDEPAALQVARRTLERVGLTTVTAVDGSDGLSVYRRDPDQFAAVLLDLSLPSLGGDEVFREIRKMRPDARVLLTSGYSETEATRQFSGKGLAGFLQKPYSPNDLVQKMRGILEARTSV